MLELNHRQFGLDKPVFPDQFFDTIGQWAQGNLGISWSLRRPVGEVLVSKLGYTLLLISCGQIFSILFGIALGLFAGWKRKTAIDVGACFLGVSEDAGGLYNELHPQVLPWDRGFHVVALARMQTLLRLKIFSAHGFRSSALCFQHRLAALLWLAAQAEAGWLGVELRDGVRDPAAGPASLLVGTVIPGDGRGRTIGIPTANIDVPAGKVIPLNGVYVPPVLRSIVELVGEIVLMATSLLMAILAWPVVSMLAELDQRSQAANIPLVLLQAMMPIGFLLMAVLTGGVAYIHRATTELAITSRRIIFIAEESVEGPPEAATTVVEKVIFPATTSAAPTRRTAPCSPSPSIRLCRATPASACLRGDNFGPCRAASVVCYYMSKNSHFRRTSS